MDEAYNNGYPVLSHGPFDIYTILTSKKYNVFTEDLAIVVI